MNFKNAASKSALVARKLIKEGKLRELDAEAFMVAYTNAHLKGTRKGWSAEKIKRRAKARYFSKKLGLGAIRLLMASSGIPRGADAVDFALNRILKRGAV